ncbi:murein transglycosylase [Exiguobacterium sp. SH31]|uniref:3D domain-containing protein n=1 Tax=unclassified Exiguobacterium TaxID=2644629 RepID=UPI0008AAD531|nr:MULTISPECIES: 3D domain-containing protein [unclassified Exiguobacterium]OGX80707.1 murein transglycosylase [Exiguobacterium sp. SH31]TCI69914.1 murein transglycosylase [Exiguobacterium sp. SH0S7]
MTFLKYMMTLLFVLAGTFVVSTTANAAQIGIGTEQKIVQNPLELERKAIELERQQKIEREKQIAEEKRRAEEKRVAEEQAKQQAEQEAKRLAEAKRIAAEEARLAEEAKAEQAKAEQATTNAVATPVSTSSGRVIQAESTAYTNDAADNGSYGGRVLTATGHDVTDSIFYNGMRIIAVDPAVIPLGKVVQIEGIGQAIALDTGGRIKGNIVDLLVDTKSEAINWGRRHVTITLP